MDSRFLEIFQDIFCSHKLTYEITEIHNYMCLGPELQCLLKVKEDLSLVLLFQRAILHVNAK